MCRMLRWLVLFWICGCNPPLVGGLYDFQLVDVVEDGCGLEIETGTHDDGSLWWGSGRDEMIVLTDDGCWYWDYADDAVTSVRDYSLEVTARCEALVRETSEGVLTSTTSFTFSQSLDVEYSGDCQALGVTSCSVEVGFEVDRIGDTDVPWEEC